MPKNPNTIGAAVNELVAKHGNSTTGLYILEQAFLAAHGHADGCALIAIRNGNGKRPISPGVTARWEELFAKEGVILAGVLSKIEADNQKAAFENLGKLAAGELPDRFEGLQ